MDFLILPLNDGVLFEAHRFVLPPLRKMALGNPTDPQLAGR
jgi:hypothetical protein